MHILLLQFSVNVRLFLNFRYLAEQNHIRVLRYAIYT